ncbi:hypothetical protein SAMN05216309_12128 [Nitrosomonas europaea]|nr:hypothetical protein SAMN05216310_12028 [Nitrosomonas europaea]SET14972.1 hypothetical protein SAMN05216309_12128 [Nitrosomonas europaea]SJZ63803.1 hypothetical protein SAMN02745113_01491 [Nitrosomonas europaea]
MDFFILRFHGEYTASGKEEVEALRISPGGEEISTVAADLLGNLIGRLYSCLKR